MNKSIRIPRRLVSEIASHLDFAASFFCEYGDDFDSPRYKRRGTRADNLYEKLKKLLKQQR